MVYESISHGPKAVTPSVNTTMLWFSRPKFRVSGLKDTNGKGKFKRMFSFLFVDKESFWLRNRLLTNSTMFSFTATKFWKTNLSIKKWGKNTRPSLVFPPTLLPNLRSRRRKG